MTHRRGASEVPSPALLTAGVGFGREREAGGQDGIPETVWCPRCQRDHRVVRCTACGQELPSQFLIHFCESCKQAGAAKQVTRLTHVPIATRRQHVSNCAVCCTDRYIARRASDYAPPANCAALPQACKPN